jgi:hypothetical protein
MKTLITYVPKFVMLLVVVLFTTTLQAQSISSGQLVLQATDHLTVYQVDEDGQFISLAVLPDTFGILNYLDAEWLIPTWREIVASPNGQFISFVAYHRESHDTALFLYNITQGSVKQIDLSGLGSIYWSPASDGIALAPPREYLDVAEPLNQIYLYDLPSDQLTEITATSGGSSGPLLWLPDNQHIVFVGSIISCDQPCVTVRNLYSVDRAGVNSVALTDLANQIPSKTTAPYDFCYPQATTWDSQLQRIFYSLNCEDSEENRWDLLYSVTSNLDNRLEVALHMLFPNDEYSSVHNLLSLGGSVYAIVNADTSQNLEGTPTTVRIWRLLRLSQPQSSSVVFEGAFDLVLRRNLIQVAASPNNEFLALIGFDIGGNKAGYLIVVDVNTGQLISESQTTDQICSLQWLNNQQLLYTEIPKSQCNPYPKPGGTFLFNIQSKATQIVSNSVGISWLILAPQVPQ